jgi:hypothetical protein
LDVKISSLMNFSQNNPLGTHWGTHWEVTGSTLRTSITDARSTCYHGFIECQTSCLRNQQLALKRSGHCIHSTNWMHFSIQINFVHLTSSGDLHTKQLYTNFTITLYRRSKCNLKSCNNFGQQFWYGDPTMNSNYRTILVQYCIRDPAHELKL